MRALPRTLVAALLLGLVAGVGTFIWSAGADRPASGPPANPDAGTPAQAAPDSVRMSHRVIAYYFHTTQRCASCRKIEAYTHEAIEAAFAQELADGRLTWWPVNIDEKENKHFVKDYRLFTKSLVLVEEKDGVRLRWNNLARVWQLLDDKENFLRYVQSETRAYLEAERP
jgi:hypothetical protein